VVAERRRYVERPGGKWLSSELPGSKQARWDGRQVLQEEIQSWPIGTSSENFQSEDLEKVGRPAVGFWLFPIDALGPLHAEGLSEEERFRHRVNTMLDMSGHWPDLALA
jgi:hypothetical protein